MDEIKGVNVQIELPLKHKIGILIVSTAAGFVASTLAEKGYRSVLASWPVRTPATAE